MNRVYFIGIGGIGVSSLAQYYLSNGWKVSGSDAVKSEITDDLKKRRVRIYIGQKLENIKTPDLVVYSAVIKPDLKSNSVVVFMSAGDLDDKIRIYLSRG